MSSGRAQVLVDEQQLQQIQAELARRGVELERLKGAMETLSAVNTPAHFVAAAMALCNELASRMKAERVGIGFLKGRYVRLKALSHTEKITRHMQLVQDIEGAMEECLDQDVEILFPPPKEASFVYRSTETLSSRNGPNAVVSLPLRRAVPGRATDERLGNVVAVLTVERKIDQPFTLAEIETLRLTCDLFTSRLVDLYEHDRWIGAKALTGTRRTLSWVVGAKHTWPKVIAVAAAGFIAFSLLVDGTFKVEAPFTFEAEKQTISAPFAGRLLTVSPYATPGDMVFSEETAAPFDALNESCGLSPVIRVPRPVTVMATLDTAELEERRVAALGERDAALKAADIARKEGKIAEYQKAEYEAAQAEASSRLYSLQIAQAVIKTPIDGIIFSGDLRSKRGAPVQQGDELYQIGQLQTLRAELSVPEDQVSEMLAFGQNSGNKWKGILKTTSYPDRPIRFTVERINPVASVSGTKNVFKVRATIAPEDIQPWMRPGMEGLAKVEISKARYAWIWTHRLINWVRMKLWI
jgi:hypothetical protein